MNSFSQKNKRKEREIFAFGAGAGILTFNGDVGKNSSAGYFSSIRTGFSFSAEKYLGKNFSASFFFLNGKIARDEDSSDNLSKANFESPLLLAGAAGTFFAAGRKKHSVIPFFSAGISYLAFDPHSDLLDKNGKTYYYWTDGSIRDLPQLPSNFYAQILYRDYTYETRLGDSIAYPRNTFCIPLAAGIKFSITERLDSRISFAYNFSFSDYLDNVKTGGTDAYLFSSVCIAYHFFSLAKEEKEKVSTTDFAGIDKTDNDADGIIDADDLCPGTPDSVRVDAKGCPMDSDADGVPDYIDKEPHSKGGLPVDADGVELTKKRLEEMHKKNLALKAEERSKVYSSQFNRKPSEEFLKLVEEMLQEQRSQKAIPGELKIADLNNDGFISAEEISKTIDRFFEGSIDFSVEKMNRLIDFFFEQ